MSDAEEAAELQDEYLDDQSHQACYIYRPFTSDNLDGRPKKKRKTQHQARNNNDVPPRLLHGEESDSCSRQRSEKWDQFWAQKQKRIEQLISEADHSILAEVVDFVETTSTSKSDGRLPTGLVVFGPDSSVQDRLLRSWKPSHSGASSPVLIQLRASSCPNLQTALKNTIKHAIVEEVGSDNYTAFLAKHRKLVPMNFDLELLQFFVEEQQIHRVVVAIAEIETFDTVVLSQLLWSLSAWSQRIPFVILLGIATTVELFESRLPRSTVEVLDPKIFRPSAKDDLLYKVFELFQHAEDAQLHLGPLTISALHEASQSQATTVETFANILKVIYLSHYFSNALCVLVKGFSREKQDHPLLCRAIRNTTSFQQHCEDLLETSKATRSVVQRLLSDDNECLQTSLVAVSDGQASLKTLSEFIAGIKDLYHNLGLRRDSPFKVDLELYSRSEDLEHSEIVNEIIVAVESLPASKLLALLNVLNLSTIQTLGLQKIHDELRGFEQGAELHNLDSLSTEKIQTTTTRKSTLSKKSSKKAQSTPSSTEQSYSTVLHSLTLRLLDMARSHRFNFGSLMNEAFIINARQPLLSIVTPRPRQILERALSKPVDYLGCDCDYPSRQEDIHGDSNSMNIDNNEYHAPLPTAILYGLLQEAGTVVNVRDLFDAFQSRLAPIISANGAAKTKTEDNSKDDEDDAEIEDESTIAEDVDEDKVALKNERLTLCLFYRSVAELKMLGMVKSSTSTMTKKRALALEGGVNFVGRGKKAYAEIDFIAKTSWAGL